MTQKEYLIVRYGAKTGGEYAAALSDTLETLDALCQGESKARAKTMREKILPRIAMYQVLSKGLSTQEAYEAVWDYTKTCVCAPVRQQYARLEGLPFFFSLYRRIFLHIIRTGEQWDTDIRRSERNRFAFDIHRCLWHDTCVRCGCPELCRVFCDSDYENFGGMRKTEFSRTQTLGTGGSVCDFEFRVRKAH